MKMDDHSDGRYWRKKPVVIEARQYTRESREEIIAWCDAGHLGMDDDGAPYELKHLLIHTLEGDHRAALGDWIIKGVKGEFYPCKPDIFEATYEAVSAAEGNEAEAAAPKPDPAIAELVRPIIGIENRTAQEVFDIMADRFRHALTASNDRVAELERERDEALATMRRATEAMVESGNLLADEELKREAAEAEVSRLKAGAVTEGWRPIETVPKDGSWVELWRSLPVEDGPYFEPLIIARWYTFDDGDEAWAWPDDVFEVWTPHGRQRAEEMMSAGDCYEDAKTFTHWRPLSDPPAALSNQAGASK